MAFLADPARTPAQVRENVYDRACDHCGAVVIANAGHKAYLLWDERLGKNTWRAAHHDYDEEGKTCYEYVLAGAPKVNAVTGPIAAAQHEEAKRVAITLDVAAEAVAEAKIVPEADALQHMLQEALDGAVTAIGTEVAAQFTALVPAMVAAGVLEARPISISVNNAPAVTIDRHHKALPDVLTMVVAGTSPFLVGPAGSGKTTLAEQVATCLDRRFYMASRVTSEYKLTGFVDANGKCVRTAFREAYEHGGVFLFDEIDASDADALTAFNAALAGKFADFPDGLVHRHADFVALAAGNTFGRGADRQYVSRNQLDAATLDRFQVYEVDYDQQLEIQLAGDPEWTARVQAIRAAIEEEKVRHVVSPRASISGARLLKAGWDRAKVEEVCVWKGLDAGQRSRVMAKMVTNARNVLGGL